MAKQTPKTQVIEMVFEDDGTVSVETKGFVGKSCKEASKFIEEALGEVVPGSEKLTAEFYQKEGQQENKLSS